MPRIIKQKIGLVFGCHTSNEVDWSVFVVVRYVVSPADFLRNCATHRRVAAIRSPSEESSIEFFQELVPVIDACAVGCRKTSNEVRLGRRNTMAERVFVFALEKEYYLELPWHMLNCIG